MDMNKLMNQIIWNFFKMQNNHSKMKLISKNH